MAWQIQSACLTHPGHSREKNEDNYYYNRAFLEQDHTEATEVQEWNFTTNQTEMLGVFDGMGGECAGDLASFVSAASFYELFWQRAEQTGLPDEETIRELFQDISGRVYDAATEQHYRLIGSTMTMLCFYGKEGLVTNLGDSPMYLLRDGTMKQISHPHTDAELLASQNIQRKPGLTQFLGINPQEMLLDPYIQKISIRKGDTFLICSDGLTDMVSEEQIAKMLQAEETVKEQCLHLRDEALENGGKDNITIIVCRVV
jgi:protein phosphatase